MRDIGEEDMVLASSMAARLIVGFVAGALAVAVFHQGLYAGLANLGLVQGSAYSMVPVPPAGVPRVLSLMFWGGVWGVVYALLVDRLPGDSWVAKGLLFSIAPLLFGWFVVAGLRGQPAMGGLVPARMLVSIALQAIYGVGVALFYQLATRRR